uniref:Uncharacterized protein n=1 Tax=Odontella aurita TaxID=265563 RepID=A0A7S4K946_9STRA|mmetsp:Transcript_6714/g.19876  ORF Transcript_6714/g.19876 Transcript_6714/m.19876 type:complete len:234 (+) Transcript_6714:100-801(+)|eukprot:CAMPEP_0113554876 /NCGR_PEP_ID=MMETSP0015_2-20120614/16398_1 /TAXON_ID=2838 /ORGANISM="Odontella" /LENGTH=233 /DNA_ID=CAMNT_0000456077 /DNA_START=100 /DNA_END=801 /DNA_ORIENTATION=+ /assembly_acc=CAM_ASM_000160
MTFPHGWCFLLVSLAVTLGNSCSACSAFTAGSKLLSSRVTTSRNAGSRGPGGSQLFASRDVSIRPSRREIIGSVLATSASVFYSATPAAQAATSDALVQLIVPIVEMSNEFDQVKSLIKDKNQWPRALKILQANKYNKPEFKKTFNTFGDNMGNVGGDGGSAPKTEQSLAYLLRNDLLTNVENLTAELEYLVKNEDDTDDLYLYADKVVGAMEKYLNIAPPGVVEEAQKRLQK